MNGRRRAFHQDVIGTAMAVAICTTTHFPPPQHPVPPPPPVFVYLHRNVQKSMEMNQTLQAVSVVLKDVLLLVRIATNLLVFVELYHIAVKKMDLLPTMLPVSVDHLNVLLIPVSIVLNLLVRVLLDHLVLKPMELLLILLHVVVVQQNVLRILVYSVSNQAMVQHVVT